MNSRTETRDDKDLTSRTIVATGWAGALQVVRQIYQFIIWVVLARVLTPEDYGLVGMATVVAGFVQTFVGMGLNQAIIQQEDLDEDHLCSAFWGGLGFGAILTTSMMILSPAISAFYAEPRLVNIVNVISIGFITNSLPVVHIAKLQRELRFKEVGIANAIGLIPAIVVALALAFGGGGYWSLVIGPLLIGPTTLICAIRITKWKPRRGLVWIKLRDLLRFGSNIAGASIARYLSNNLDYFLIGRFLGATSLGIYTLAYQIMILPLQYVSSIMGVTIFSAFARIQHDEARIRRGYLKVVHFVSCISFPLMAGLYILAPDFIPLVFGPKWIDAVPIIRVFCIVGVFRSVGTFVGTIFKARNRPDIEFKWSLIVLAVFIPVLLFSAQRDIATVAWGVTCIHLLLTPIIISIANRLIMLQWRLYFSNLSKPFVLSLIMMTGMWLVVVLIRFLGLGSIEVVICSILTGGIIYLLGTWLTNKEPFLEIASIFLRKPIITKIEEA